MPAYPWGGNMDLRELSPGATLFLPVQVPGGLLSLGDLHAAMGAAEPTWVSLEAAGRATLRIGLEKGNGYLASPAPGRRRDDLRRDGGDARGGYQSALDQAYDLLLADGLELFDAYAFASARVGMRFGGPAAPIVLAVVPDR